MTIIFTFLLVALAIASIFSLRPLIARVKIIFHPNPTVDYQIKFQVLQLVLTAIVLLLVYFLHPANFWTFFRAGDVKRAHQQNPIVGGHGE